MQEKIIPQAVLVFPVKQIGPKKVLLGKKIIDPNKHKPGAGKWNGFGGSIEKGESPEEAVVRELKQESGIVANIDDLVKSATLYFHNRTIDGNGDWTCTVYAYLLYKWFESGDVIDGEMEEISWFHFDKMPWNEMIPGDSLWLPSVLSGEKIIAHVPHGPKQGFIDGWVTIKKVRYFS